MFRKQPKPRTFDYRPRYYDPEKERSRLLRPSNGDNPSDGISGIKSRISRHFRDYNKPSESSSIFSSNHQARQSNLRLVVILILLLLGSFWLLINWLPQIVSMVE